MIKNIFGWNRTKDLLVKNYLFEFRKDDELANLQESLDKEMHDRQKLVKELRAVQNQNHELKEDLDAEKASRLKIDKAWRDSNAAQHEENQAKLGLQLKLRQVEEQLEDAESAKKGNFRHIYSNSSRINYRSKFYQYNFRSCVSNHFPQQPLEQASKANRRG